MAIEALIRPDTEVLESQRRFWRLLTPLQRRIYWEAHWMSEGKLTAPPTPPKNGHFKTNNLIEFVQDRLIRLNFLHPNGTGVVSVTLEEYRIAEQVGLVGLAEARLRVTMERMHERGRQNGHQPIT